MQAIVFDLDGTLVDSLDDIANALFAAMADHGLPLPTRDQVRSWIGSGARTLVVRAVEPALVDPVFARFRVHYAAAPVVHTALYPGLAPVLDRFVAAGARLAVLTNKPHELTVSICDRLLARWPFSPIVGARDGVPLKPDPTTALAIARELGVPPDACALVGDAGTDIATARAAGMRPVGVTWGFRPRTDLVDAALVVDTPDELGQLLSKEH
jgi:phosphoglycolate phosphatase